MSTLSSWSKSPTPATCHSDGAPGIGPEPTGSFARPSIFQRMLFPVAALRQRTSAIPSSWKSPRPTIRQADEAEPTIAAPTLEKPFISQAATLPVTV